MKTLASLNATTHGLSYHPAYHAWYKHKHTGITLVEYITEQELKCPECVLKPLNGELVSMSKADATRLQKMRSNNTSGYRNTYFHKRDNLWYWQIMVKGVSHGESGFDTAVDAALARDNFVITNGIKTRMNFEVH